MPRGIYSPIETARTKGNEPPRYLEYLLDRLPYCAAAQECGALLPYRLLPSSYAEN
jgi:hypothetical protein